MMGAGMLCVGWYGFNGGSALAGNGDTAAAHLVTHLSAATAGLVWAIIEMRAVSPAVMRNAERGIFSVLAISIMTAA